MILKIDLVEYSIVLVPKFQPLVLIYTNGKQGYMRSYTLPISGCEDVKMCPDVLSTAAPPQ